jgi:hypothetical protein
MADTDDDIPQARDAIPKEAIWLTDAYEWVASLASNHPENLPKFDGDWSEALRKSKELERKIQDPEVYDGELEGEWHRRKEANLILRLGIEAKELVAYVRDPLTGEILQLSSDDWIPSDWDDYIPSGIWSDYIIPDDYEAPGPNGTLIRGALRPVFFMLSEFEVWFKQTLGGTKPAAKTNVPIRDPVLAHRQLAVIEAVIAKWGENGPPPGVMEEIRRREINRWLSEHGRAEVSEPTIRRALRKMRRERT